MNLLVLAGGFGTRLKAVVADVPKPLAPVAGHPFLCYQIRRWVEQGVNSIVFSLHYEAEQIVRFINDHRLTLLSGCQVQYVVEPRPMGTGGALAYAVRELQLSGKWLVTNADTWLGRGLAQMWGEPTTSMAVLQQRDASRYGTVEFDAHGVISAFREKKVGSGMGWINAGLYTISADMFRGIDEAPISMETQIFPAMVERGELRAVPIKADFIDIGVPEDYRRFSAWQLAGRVGWL